METLINPNQIGNRPKILNVVQTGILTRDGAVFSGFSQDNYLQLGDIENIKVLPPYTKDFGLAIASATNFEIVFKITYINTDNSQQSLFSDNRNNGSGDCNSIVIESNSKLRFIINNGTSDTSDLNYISDLTLSSGTDYYIRLKWTGTQYYFGYSTDGTNYTEDTITSSLHWSYTGSGVNWVIGFWQSGLSIPFKGNIDFSESYIKINGEYWWKGVETL